MANGKIKGKQIDDDSVSLNKLSGAGSVILDSGSQIQITGTAVNPNDVVTKKELPFFNLQVSDYKRGVTFSNIENIIFRGQTVNVPNGTAIGVWAEQDSVPPKSVMVWIPGIAYPDPFNTASNIITPIVGVNRLAALPNGDYIIGDWANNVNGARKTINVNTVSWSCTDFYVHDLFTTIDFNFYNGNGIISSSVSLAVNSVNSVWQNGLLIWVTAFSDEQDRYKASVYFRADFVGGVNGSALPNGGRFSVEMIHNNSADGIYTFRQDDLYFDVDGTSSSASINGSATVLETVPVLKWLSGIAYYDIGSQYLLSVINMDLLNDISYPMGLTNDTNPSTGQQLRVTTNNMGINTSYWGHSTDFVGWTSSYNAIGFDYFTTATLNIEDVYIPYFSVDNELSLSNPAYITARIYDWNLADSINSANYYFLIDTYDDVTRYNNNPIIDEGARLPMSNLDKTAPWDETAFLPNDELQMIFGRVIYPQDDFGGFFPQINITNNRDYTLSSPTNKTFIVWTDVTTPTGLTTSVAINGYRWFATSYGKSVDYDIDFGNGIFVLSSNFGEVDLHHDQVVSGNEDLVILIGIDSTGANQKANTFLWVSNNAIVYSGRTNAVIYTLNGTTKQIQFSKGSLSFSVRRVWLVLGYKNNDRGHDLYVNDISFS